MSTIARNRDGFEVKAFGEGSVLIWCESCEDETPHLPIDAYDRAWMRACGDAVTTHYCEPCDERKQGV